jgi:hypothetical protein
MILDQRFDSETCETVPQDPTDCVLVFPEAKNFLVFEGNLGHGVLESVSSDERMTLLVNWWTSQPQVCSLLVAEECEKPWMTIACYLFRLWQALSAWELSHLIFLSSPSCSVSLVHICS